MPIAYKDPTGQTLVAHLAPGVAPLQAARALNLAPKAWRVIAGEEAAELQRPVELAEDRRAEIKAELAQIDRLSLRPLRALVASPALADDQARLAKLETRAEKLRAELAGLEGPSYA